MPIVSPREMSRLLILLLSTLLFGLVLTSQEAHCQALQIEPAAEAQDDSSKEPPQLVLDTHGFHGAEIRALAISDNDEFLAVAGGKEVRVWNLHSGELYATLRGYREPDGFSIGNINCVAFAPGNRYLVVGVSDNTPLGSTRVYDLLNPDELHQLLPGNSGCTNGAVLSRTGKYLATFGCGPGPHVVDIDLRTGSVTVAANFGNFWPNSVPNPAIVAQGDFFGFPIDDDWLYLRSSGHQFVFSMNRKTVVPNKAEWPLSLQLLLKRDSLCLPPPGGHDTQYTTNVDYRGSDNNWKVRGGSTDGRFWVAVWSQGIRTPSVVYYSHRYIPKLVTIGNSGRYVVSADLLGEVHVWDATTGRQRYRLRPDHQEIYGVKWSGDGSILYWSDQHYLPGTYNYNHFGPLNRAFDLRRRRFIEIPADAHILDQSRTPNPTILDSSAQQLRRMEIANAEAEYSDKTIRRFKRLEFSAAPIDGSLFKKDGLKIEPSEFDQDRLMTYIFLPNAQSRTNSLQLALGTERGRLEQYSIEESLGEPDGNRTHRATIEKSRDFRGHSAFVTGLSQSPDGQMLASSSIDGTIRIWSLRPTRDTGDVPFYCSGNRVTGVVNVIPPHIRQQVIESGVLPSDLAIAPPEVAPVDLLPTPGEVPIAPVPAPANGRGPYSPYILTVTPAAMGTIKIGDLVHEFDGINFYERRRRISAGLYRPGDEVTLTLSRDGIRYQAKVALIPIPAIDEPLLSLFFSSDGEWITWTPSGFYDTSPGGERYVGFHLNNGRRKSARFFGLEQFRQHLYRPDIVAKSVIPDNERDHTSLPSQEKVLPANRTVESSTPRELDLSIREEFDKSTRRRFGSVAETARRIQKVSA